MSHLQFIVPSINKQFYQQFKAMIIAYCLSIHAINFFRLPTFEKFKFHLINQQTGDTADSPLFNAHKIQSTDFPVVINLKGSDKLLMKIKMLAFPTRQGEKLIGEGVVNFTKNDINNSLRLPIYDKKSGIEEVAICSVDLFVSGFVYRNGNVDKSRSRIEDWRQRSDDIVYSQMSYTLVSEQQREQELKNEKNHPLLHQKQTQKDKFSRRTGNAIQNQQEKDPTRKSKLLGTQLQQPPNRRNINQAEQLQNNRHLQPIILTLEQQSNQIEGEQAKNSLPLQNTIYLGNSIQQQNEDANQKPALLSQRKKTQIDHLKSIEMLASLESQNSKIYSPQKLKEQIKESEKLMNELKRYLSERHREDQIKSKEAQQHKIYHKKIRRQTVKVQEISAYKFQNNFIDYQIITQATKSPKIIKNFRAVKIINNQIKESKDQIILDIAINKVELYLMNGKRIVSLDAMGYRYFCITNHIKQNTLQIKIPPSEISIRANVIIQNEGQFEGVIGMQEGQQMAIYLNTKAAQMGPVLNKQEFKLYFDIKKQFSIKPIKTALLNNNNQVSFRQPYEPSNDSDLRNRITSMSLQPWGYVKSYSEDAKGSKQTLQILDKINDRLSDKKLMDKIRYKNSSSAEPQRIKITNDKAKRKVILSKDNNQNKQSKFDKSQYSFLMNKFCTSESSQNQQVIQHQQKKQSLKNSPIRKKTRKRDPQNLNESQISETNEIMSIRNGNRNNYKFKNKTEQSQIKQLWQKLLIKKKMSQEKSPTNRYRQGIASIVSTKKRVDGQRQGVGSILQTKKKSMQNINDSSFMKESDLSSSGSKMSSRNNQYKFKKMNDSSSSGFDINQATKIYPLRSLTLEIKNISITQPQIVINQDQETVGKFVKIYINDKVQYFTEVIFNEGYNSILWKLEGCIFTQLTGSEKVELEVYQAHDDQITVLGKSFIRISKLHFLKNNHIYNGKIIYKNMLNGEYTLGFNIVELYPFQIIQEEDEETTIKHLPKIYPSPLNKQHRNHHQKYRIVQNNLSPKKTSRISRSLEQTDLKKIKIVNNLQNKQMQNMTVLKRQENDLETTKKRQDP